MIFLSWETHRLHWALCPHVSLVNLLISFRQYFFLLPSYLFWQIFDKRIMQVCGDIMGLGLWEFIQGLLMRCQA